MNNLNDIELELKKVRDELFKLKFEQRMTKDEYTLNRLKEKESIVLNKYKELTVQKVFYEDKKGRKK